MYISSKLLRENEEGGLINKMANGHLDLEDVSLSFKQVLNTHSE